MSLLDKMQENPQTYFPAAGVAAGASAAGAAGAAAGASAAGAAGAAGASTGASTGASVFLAQPTKETELTRKRKTKNFFIAMFILVV